MTRQTGLCVCRLAALAALSAFCLWQGIDAASAYLGSADAHRYLSDWRAAARSAPDGKLALMCKDAGRISPVDRSRLVAVSWERAPEPVGAVDASCPHKADCVLSSKWTSRPVVEKLKSEGFSAVSENGYVTTWSRGGDARRVKQGSTSGVPFWREIVALSAELALVVLGLSLATGLRNVGILPPVVSVAVGVALGAVALSHSLLAPNGLGVYGGKGKMLFECGGMPRPFLESAGGMALQPSYPPGLALLAWLHFALSGGCGDRLVQLVVVFATAALCLAMLRKMSSPWTVPSVALFCLTPVAIRMASGFYAEPFAALSLILGWSMIGDGRRFSGAIVMGLAGLFRLEAGVVAAAFAAGAGAFCGGRLEKLLVMAASIAPAIAWLAACTALGYGCPADWDFCKAPKFGQIAYAAWSETKALGMHVLPMMAMALMGSSGSWTRLARPWTNAAAALVPWAVLLLAIPVSCGFHTSPNAEWMIDNTIPRIVWQVSAVPLLALGTAIREEP